MPPFEDIPEILSEQKPLETASAINDIDPQTSVDIGHCFEGFPQWLMLLDLDVGLQVDSLHERSDGDVVVELGFGLVGYPQQVKQYVFEAED